MSEQCYTLNNGCVEYIPLAEGEYPTLHEEAAGKIGRVLGVVASIFLPMAAPAILGWGAALTGSGFLATAIHGAATFLQFGGGAFGQALGAGILSGVGNAAIAFASGASSADVLRAGLSGGVSGFGMAGGLRAMGVPFGPQASTAVGGAPTTAGLQTPAAGTPLAGGPPAGSDQRVPGGLAPGGPGSEPPPCALPRPGKYLAPAQKLPPLPHQVK